MLDIMSEKDVLLDVDELAQEIKYEKRTFLQPYIVIRAVNSACDKNLKELKKLQSKYEILQKIEPLELLIDNEAGKDLFSTSESKKRFKNKVISSLLFKYYEEFQNNYNDLLFFAAATFNLFKLREIIKSFSSEEINQSRFSDSVIIFTLKYGDVNNNNFLECVKILIEAGVDINKSDASGRFAIDYVVILFNKNVNPEVQENLRKIAILLLNQRICHIEEDKTRPFIENELKFDLSKYTYACMDFPAKLFFWISRQKIQEFKAFKIIHHFVNSDNGEYTIFQCAVNKSKNMLPVVEILLKNGADPNRVTEANPLTPLEMAARNNYENIFKVILNWKATRISKEQFNYFVKWRSFSIKRELFGVLLGSDKLDPSFVYEETGNTPLHYAVRLSYKHAIQKLLKRPNASLTLPNICGKCPLDILNAADLNTYLDSCLIFDTRRTIDFNSNEYKMQFRFRRLTDGNLPEVDVVSQLSKCRHLEHLLAHPLVHTYIMLKWFKIKIYFWIILGIQAFLFTLLSGLSYRFPYSSLDEHIFFFFVILLNIVLKCWVFLNPKKILNSRLSLTMKTTLHEWSECLLMITLIASFFINEFRAFVFIEMAIVFLLTVGYHPNISHWSVMFQTVFTTFTKLLVFFSLLMVAFAVGFHIMFEEHRFFTALYRSVFMSYFMTIGEINVSEVDFETTPFGGYLLFFIFAMSMSVVLINIWTGVAIRDIDKFEKRSEVNALKNVIAFMSFIEKHVYSVNCLRKMLPNPLLFSKYEETYVVDFYVNKDDQFERKISCWKKTKDFYVNKDDQFERKISCWKKNQYNKEQINTKRRYPQRLDKNCCDKIKLYYYKQQNITNEHKILVTLDKILQNLEAANQNKNRTYSRQNTMV